MKEYEVELRITKFIKIKAENDYDAHGRAMKLAELNRMNLANFILLDGQMEPDKYSKPDIHPSFDAQLNFIENINKI